MVPRRSLVAELFAPHDKSSGTQAGTFASDVASGLGSQNYYDPDRAAFQQLLAEQMGGTGSQTGSQMAGAPYGLNQGQDPYSPGPGVNPNLGTFGPGGQPGVPPTTPAGTAPPYPGATVPGSGSNPVVGPRTALQTSPAATTQGMKIAPGPTANYAADPPPEPTDFLRPKPGDYTGGITSYPRPQPSGGPTVVPPRTGGTTPPGGSTGGAAGGGLAGARDATGGLVFGGLAQMLADPNIPQSTKDAIQQQGALTARAGYAGANEGILRNAAATGNAGGTAAALAQTGRAQAGTLADLNRQNNIAFEQEAQRRKETALSGLSNYYGQTSQNYNTLAGMRAAGAFAPVGSQTGARNLTKGVQTGKTDASSVNWI